MRYIPGGAGLLRPDEVNAEIERVFREYGEGRVQMPPKIYVTFEQGDFRTMPAYLPGMGIAGVKIVNVHPENPSRGLPTVMALTVILDPETGVPQAVLNATELTDMRTGAAGAVAARHLSPRQEVVLGVVGSGRQALAQVNAIREVLEIQEVRVWSRTDANARRFCRQIPDIPSSAGSVKHACDADVIVTTTPSRTPVVRSEWVNEGTHINAIGADAPGKQELDPALLLRSSVFVDDLEQALHSGEINVPIAQGIFSADRIAGTLGDIVCGRKKRTSNDEITIFDSTGLAIQDLAIASLVMAKGDGIDLPFP
ncbi:ornithine cyclodeaminase family protein [Methanofollis fontis]|uniref:Alanine dehydrogenase n=1 Tax=Methanofollis fontis TaxID=2052832 RepID=A0A483CU05_9EURY|nr:ornithine cyclodeaminase family protein [Methanofollis fontis]TAJ44764.1 ornithine cyclodeaminase family protein [Methanofollis fontis]